MTTFTRILLAVDDSPAALSAIDVAVELVVDSDATLRAVTVTEDGTLAATLDELNYDSGAESRISRAADAILAHVERTADQQGVRLETTRLVGEPFQAILEDARRWDADVIVMGRSDRKGPASPYVGSEVERVLEFSEIPVLVVPRMDRTEDVT